MSTRTEFGRSCQSSREFKGMSLLAFAKAIGVSPSFVCAVEIGEKPAPEGYVGKAAQALGLDERAGKRLRERELRSRNSFKIDDVRYDEAQLLAAFIENRHHLSKESLQAATKTLQFLFDFSEGQNGKTL